MASITATDDDPLVEIKPHHVLKKSEITDDNIRSLIIKCSACDKQLNPHSRKLRKHSLLKVLICEECKDFYSSGEFSQDEDGDKYCRWCGNGGKLFGCDYCTNSFCVTCIRRNLGRSEVREIEDTDWKCYGCDSSKLEQKVSFCDMILEYSKDKSRWKVLVKKITSYTSSSAEKYDFESDGFVESFFNQAKTSCSNFQGRLLKLETINTDRAKSEKHVFEKMQHVFESFTADMKKMSNICQQYTQFVKQKSARPKHKQKSAHCNNVPGSSSDETLPIASLDDTKVTSDGENIACRSAIEKKDDTSDKESPAELRIQLENNDTNGDLSDSSKMQDDAPNSVEILEELSTVNGTRPHSPSILDTVNNIVSDCAKENEKLDVAPTVTSNDGVVDVAPTVMADKSGIASSKESPAIAANNILPLIKKILFSDSESSDDSFMPDLSIFYKKDSSEGTDKKEKNSEPADDSPSTGSKNVALEKNYEKQGESDLEIESQSESEPNKKNKSKSKTSTKFKESDLKLETESLSESVPNKKNKSKSKTSTECKESDLKLDSSSSSSIEMDSSDYEVERKVTKKDRSKRGLKKLKASKLKHVDMEKLLNDPKLKQKAYVLVEKLVFSIDGDLCNKVINKIESPEDDSSKDEDDELKKKIDALSRLPKIKCSSATIYTKEDRSKEGKTKHSKSKIKSQDEEKDDDSSSVISFSSEDDRSDKEIAQAILSFKDDKDKNEEKEDANAIAKKSLLAKIESDDDSTESSSGSEVIAPTTKKRNLKKGSNSDGSSDDFQPRKKTKYDKLLREPIAFQENEKKAANSKKDPNAEKEKNTFGKKKKTNRKIFSSDENKNSDSSTSEDSSNSDDDDKKIKAKKKRRRIKQMTDTSDEDGKKGKDSDVEIIGSQDTPSGKGRKNIRKVISTKKLAETTKEAQLAEKERRRRLQDRQKLYNKITEASEDGTQTITKKFVLEVDPDSKEEVVEIHPDVIEKLKPHQINGVKFMWECTIESLKELETKPGSGCILAHCMGLGKTLQVIAFLYTCLTNKYVNKHITKAMIICPYNTVLNWENEFEMWLENAEDQISLHQLASAKDNETRLDILKYWEKDGGVLIIGYDIFRRLVDGKMKFPKSKKEKLFNILTQAPDIVVCDEGHILKNESSAISKVTGKLRTQRRIVLTGTPLQNNLKEYHCMVQFVKPSLLGNSKEFRNRFVNPITNGQYDDSSQRDVKLMKKRVHILHKLLEGCVQRCDYSTLTKFLPPKHEFVISVKLSEVQIKMYRYYLAQISDSARQGKIEGRTLFSDYNSLKNIWTFPYICHTSFLRAEDRRSRQLTDSEEDFVTDNSHDDSASASSSDIERIQDLDNPTPGTSKKKDESSDDEVIRVYKTRSRDANNPQEPSNPEDEESKTEKQWYDEFISKEDQFNITTSGKIVLLLDILKECESIGDKIIVFSQSLLTLDMLEDVLIHMADQPRTDEDHSRDVIGTWSKGIDYFRMDGATSADFRKRWIEIFNNPRNERARLFLISTKAGSLGTNLIGANRVVLMDASWNPSHDVQAIFRVYRFGQIKPVYIYRLLAQGTMEEKIYDRQVTKLSLSIRVVDEQQIDRHFNAAQLAELYNFDPESTSVRPTPMVPNDRLLAEMLIRNKDWIVNYHEHDSLLQNKTEEDLTEEERQSAWNEYENEKDGLFSDSTINEELLDQLNTDPDFSSNDVTVEAELPNVNDAVKLILSKINSLYPNADSFEKSKRLLDSLSTLRNIYQAKHVKILRLKQEYFSRGIIRVPMNKYLDDIAKALNSITAYIANLQQQMNALRKQYSQQEAYSKYAAAAAAAAAANANANQGAPRFRQQYNTSTYGKTTYMFPNNMNQYPRQFAATNPGYYLPRRQGPETSAQNIQNINPSYTYVDMESGTVYASVPSARATNKGYAKPVHVYQPQTESSTHPLVTEVEEIGSHSNSGVEQNSASSVVITEID